jgi:aminopeptidase N
VNSWFYSTDEPARQMEQVYLRRSFISDYNNFRMTKNLKWIYVAVIAAFFISCSTAKKATSSNDHEGGPEIAETKDASADSSSTDSLPPYRPARQRDWDLLHTALDLSFDWEKQNVIGSATLKLTPLFYPQQMLSIDADHFKVMSLSLFGKPYDDFKTDTDKIVIRLPKPYKKGEEVTVTIDYVAHPQSSNADAGAAITNDQGLFFIDPLDTTPDLPRQIWSQGETSSNRKWYPTLDQPNERATQEITLTVPDSMMTLSNGILVSSTPAEKGMRKDYWKMDLPHAPYLAMIAVGQWDKVTDYWRGRPVEYYVDRGYGKDARDIFSNTPEMIEFFSTKLNFPFVWPKYSQIIVKNFVTGAMENTTATVFGDYIEYHREDAIADGNNDYVVAHELFHHWFGDLVTCESWANITLNEGFANYAEYLWNEYKYGRDQADLSRLEELSGYFDQAGREVHPLIYYHYKTEESVFDAHSYNKGGLVLHMLRNLVGDDAFFSALHDYLEEHKFSSVEVDDLREAFEATTGQDLHWFFNQWYFGTGHPVLDIHHQYDQASKKLTMTFHQSQGEKGYTDVFRLPIDIDVIKRDSSVIHEKVWMDQKEQTFTFDVPDRPLAVIVDPRDILLAVVNDDIDEDEYPVRALLAPSITQRLTALHKMENMDDPFIRRIMYDSSWVIRSMAVHYLSDHRDGDKLYEMSMKETNVELQNYLLESMIEVDKNKARDMAVHILKTAKRVPIIYTALTAIADVDVDEAVQQLSHFENENADAIYVVRASILAKKGNGLSLDYFKAPQAAAINENYFEDLIKALTLFLSSAPTNVQDEGMALINSNFYLTGSEPDYRIYYLITGTLNQYNEEKTSPFKDKLRDTIHSLYGKVKDDYIKGVLKQGLGDMVD